jgi:hypothetical protein
VVLTDAYAAPAGASTNDPTAGASSVAASVAYGDGGGGFHLSRGARPPSLSSSSSSSVEEFSGVAGVGGESPCCLRSRYSSLSFSRCSRCRILLSFLRAARSCSRRCAAWAAARAQGVGGSDRAASTVTLC